MMRNIFFSLIAGFVLLASCSAKVNGSLHEDGSADFSLWASLEPRMATLIRSLARLNRTSPSSEQILDGPAIALSMASAPGIKSIVLKNNNPTTIEGTISLVRVDNFLAIPESQGARRFISYEQSGSGGRFRIALDRNSGPQIVTLLSPNVAGYLSALMAPVVTGETLSKGEYLGLVRSVYGKGVADEIVGARIQVSIEFPRPISAIRGGVVSIASKTRGEFDIPLLDLLVLENPLEYEVSWK